MYACGVCVCVCALIFKPTHLANTELLEVQDKQALEANDSQIFVRLSDIQNHSQKRFSRTKGRRRSNCFLDLRDKATENHNDRSQNAASFDVPYSL